VVIKTSHEDEEEVKNNLRDSKVRDKFREKILSRG